jgi:hypothetical protein
VVRDPNERDKDPFRGQLFWSRRGGRDLSAEVDYDRFCPACGYNLRGMPMKSRCPECGALGGWKLDDEPLSWDDEQTFAAFLGTTFTVIFDPHRLARHMWRQARMDLNEARRYRRIALSISAIGLTCICFIITARMLSPLTALISLPMQAIAMVVWLNSVTLEPLSRLKDWTGSGAVARRVQAIVHYLSAPLVLTPLLVPLAIFMRPFPMDNWLLAAGIFVALLAGLLFFATLGLGWMLYELIDMPKIQAHTMALGWLITSITTAAIVLVAVPAMAALLAWRIVG